MTRDAVPFTIDDLSSFARALRAGLHQMATPPGHQECLNLVARAAGFKNHQHLRAAATPRPPKPAGSPQFRAALRDFGPDGRMIRWPRGYVRQGLCLWVFWDAIPDGDLSESAVNAVLKAGEAFGDHVILRRSLVDHHLVARTPDGRLYRRILRDVPLDAKALIAEIAERREKPIRP